MGRRGAWTRDEAFLNVAAVAWPEDHAAAFDDPEWGTSYGTKYNRKQAARLRLKHRWEGYHTMGAIQSAVRAMEVAVDSLCERVHAIAEQVGRRRQAVEDREDDEVAEDFKHGEPGCS